MDTAALRFKTCSTRFPLLPALEMEKLPWVGSPNRIPLLVPVAPRAARVSETAPEVRSEDVGEGDPRVLGASRPEQRGHPKVEGEGQAADRRHPPGEPAAQRPEPGPDSAGGRQGGEDPKLEREIDGIEGAAGQCVGGTK